MGLVLALVCYLTTNLSPGGMITPAWLALTLVQDYRQAAVIAGVTIVTILATKLLKRVVILYGKRLFAAVVLIGVLIQLTLFVFVRSDYPLLFVHQTLGFVVPGLVAHQVERQRPGWTTAGHRYRDRGDVRDHDEWHSYRRDPDHLTARLIGGFMKQQRGSAGAVLALIVGLVVFASSALIIYIQNKPSAGSVAPPTASPEAAKPTEDPDTLAFVRRTDPPRTVVQDAKGDTVAVLTDGARTARLVGPTRTFVEPAFTKRSVVTDAWIRLAPVEWSAGAETASWFAPWLTAALADRSPDVFGAAMQYVHGAPAAKDAAGIRYAGDASFGPLSATDPDGREERSDFLDYLGVPWTFPDGGLRQPQKDRYGDVDCSGFVRLVYGYRMGYPLRVTNNPGPGLPRRAFAIASIGPGVVVVPNKGNCPTTSVDCRRATWCSSTPLGQRRSDRPQWNLHGTRRRRPSPVHLKPQPRRWAHLRRSRRRRPAGRWRLLVDPVPHRPPDLTRPRLIPD